MCEPHLLVFCFIAARRHTLQMIQRPLMTPDELKSVPKGTFIVMKTGTRPMRTKLRLFLEWGITFGEPYLLPERAARKVAYADKKALMRNIQVATVNDEAQSVGTYQVGRKGAAL